MNRDFKLSSKELGSVALRTIGPADLENLRVWKNANRASFFYQGEITPEGQQRWFSGYLQRPDDYMFMVESPEHPSAGCMGFRLIEGAADCYNIMAAPGAQGRGLMVQAMRLMCSFILAKHSRRIGCKVLKSNPALSWYRKCSYRVAREEKEHHQLELDLAAFKPCSYEETALKAVHD